MQSHKSHARYVNIPATESAEEVREPMHTQVCPHEPPRNDRKISAVRILKDGTVREYRRCRCYILGPRQDAPRQCAKQAIKGFLFCGWHRAWTSGECRLCRADKPRTYRKRKTKKQLEIERRNRRQSGYSPAKRREIVTRAIRLNDLQFSFDPGGRALARAKIRERGESGELDHSDKKLPPTVEAGG